MNCKKCHSILGAIERLERSNPAEFVERVSGGVPMEVVRAMTVISHVSFIVSEAQSAHDNPGITIDWKKIKKEVELHCLEAAASCLDLDTEKKQIM